ncbi:MAG: prolyl oligopeptidase family serine peptidase [Bacteroidales bacterium]
MKYLLSVIVAALFVSNAAAQQPSKGQQPNLEYQRPPKIIEDLILAPATPTIMLSPSKLQFAILSSTNIPSIEEQAQEELRLAGVRVLAATNAPRFRTKIKQIEIKSLPGQKLLEGVIKGFPQDVNIAMATWSPNGQYISAVVEQNTGVYLWVADIASLTAKQVTNKPLNLFFGTRMFEWAPDSKSIITTFIPQERGDKPKENLKQIIPVIQTSEGESNPAQTYQDLLTDKHSEDLFNYYATSKLGIISINGGEIKYLGDKAIYTKLDYSPNGEYILAQKVKAPYSYVVPYSFFPMITEVVNVNGGEVKHINSKKLVETDFITKNSTSPYPREYGWRSDMPATLYWVEPLDGGNGRVAVEYRDKIMTINAPFSAQAKELVKTKYRFDDILWGDAQNALVITYDDATRMECCVNVSPTDCKIKREIYHLSTENLYANMGTPVMENNSLGCKIILSTDGYKTIYLSGKGYSPKGALPFIDNYNLKTGATTRLWQSANPYYEKPIEYINLLKGMVVTQRESNTQAPNYFLRNIKKDNIKQLTFFADPFPAMSGVTKEVIEYTRKDGVKLSGTLYLPSGYKKENGLLPVLMWAYPSEYKNKDNAGQRKDAPNQFIRYSRTSPELFVAAGYAVLNNASFPIIGEGDKEPNDTYIEQLVNNASAAIDKLVEMGIGDRDRIAVGGHSYGAFMTANLLANCNLFAAGIARSGAYNRTLTPFGFQNEMRTIWEAPNVYLAMSPFMTADKLKTPILLIHGQADNNTGTFTMQSERLYTALKGNGGTVRLVLLPYESHGYVAKESILHQAWETYMWLNKYVKNKVKK